MNPLYFYSVSFLLFAFVLIFALTNRAQLKENAKLRIEIRNLKNLS